MDFKNSQFLLDAGKESSHLYASGNSGYVPFVNIFLNLRCFFNFPFAYYCRDSNYHWRYCCSKSNWKEEIWWSAYRCDGYLWLHLHCEYLIFDSAYLTSPSQLRLSVEILFFFKFFVVGAIGCHLVRSSQQIQSNSVSQCCPRSSMYNIFILCCILHSAYVDFNNEWTNCLLYRWLSHLFCCLDFWLFSRY